MIIVWKKGAKTIFEMLSTFENLIFRIRKMYPIQQKDAIYQQFQILEFEDIKQLCQTNNDYAQLCKESRFKFLINNKLVQRNLDKLYTPKLMSAEYFMFSNPSYVDNLRINKTFRGDFDQISELLENVPLEESILYQLFKTKAELPNFDNLPMHELKDLMFRKFFNLIKGKNNTLIIKLDRISEKDLEWIINKIIEQYVNVKIEYKYRNT